MLTNHHELDGVYDPQQDQASRKLVAFMADLLGKELPEYYKQYNISTTPGQPVFTRKILKIFALFRWQADHAENLTLAVYNNSGVQIDVLFADRLFTSGHYELTAKFESARVVSGNYYIRLLSGTKVLQEQKVTVD